MVKFEKSQPSKKVLEQLGIDHWGIWTKEISEFSWEYDEKETFYVLEGEAEVSSGEDTISFQPGDLVTCHAGVKCTWKIRKPIKKRYYFGEL
jgi:hypothetical protein